MNDSMKASERFYSVYAQISKPYNLWHTVKFYQNRDGSIRIFQRQGKDKKIIIKVEEEDAADCYNRAADALIDWEETERRKRK